MPRRACGHSVQAPIFHRLERIYHHLPWLDSAGIAMWCALHFGPIAKAKRGNAQMVSDNCGPHKVTSVRQVFQNGGVRMGCWSLWAPAKDHGYIGKQVMDLAEIRPLREAIRHMRAKCLFSYSQGWKIDRLTAAAAHRKPPLRPFRAPKLNVEQGIHSVLQCIPSALLDNPHFQESLQKTFIKFGSKRSAASSVPHTLVENLAQEKACWLMPTIKGAAPANDTNIMTSEISGDARERMSSLCEFLTEFWMLPRHESRLINWGTVRGCWGGFVRWH